MDEYCPFDLEDDLAAFGLVPYQFDAAYGSQVGYRSAEPTSSTVRLLLHGVGGTAVSWTPLLQEYQRMGQPIGDVVIPDLPGFGASENRRSDLWAEDVGLMLIEMVRHFGWEQIHLVGHSMGGFLALDMASQKHHEVERLTIVSGAYFSVIDTANGPLRALRTHRGTAISYLGMRALAAFGPLGSWLMRAVLALNLSKPLLSGMVAEPDRLKPKVRRALLVNLRPRAFSLAAKNGVAYSAGEAWGRIDVPTKALFGREDGLVPPVDADRLAAALPKAEIHMLEGVGHFAHIERPSATREFFEG